MVGWGGYTQRSYIEGLEMNHVPHRLLYLRARAMLNSAIHTSECVGRGGFLEATRENLLLCISLGKFAVFRYQQMRKDTCLKSKDSYLFTNKSSYRTFLACVRICGTTVHKRSGYSA